MTKKSTDQPREQCSKSNGADPEIDINAIDTEAWTRQKVNTLSLAAYQIGRFLNYFDFAVERSTCYHADAQFEQVQRVVRQLTSLGKRFKKGGEIGACVRGRYGEWRKWLDSDEHSQQADAGAELSDDQLPYEWTIDRFWSKPIHRIFLRCMDAQCKAAFRLGQRLDQGLRPHSLKYSHMEGLMSATTLRHSELSTDCLWNDDVLALAERLGLSVSQIMTSSDDIVAKIVAVDQLVLTHLTEQAAQSGCTPDEAGLATVVPESHWKPACLGLELNDSNLQVRRNGGEVVDFSSSLLNWILLQKLIDEHHRYMKPADLTRVWSKCNLAYDPQPGTIHDRIFRLRKALKPLGIGIKGHRNVGWQLELLHYSALRRQSSRRRRGRRRSK